MASPSSVWMLVASSCWAALRARSRFLSGQGAWHPHCPKLDAAGRVCASLASSGCSSSCVICELVFLVFPESVKDSVSYGVCATLHADLCGDCQLCS